MWARTWLALAPLVLSAGSTQTVKSRQQVLRLAGRISAERSFDIAAPASGGFEGQSFGLSYLVSSGTIVKKGQTLVQMDGKSSTAQAESSAGELSQTKAEIARRKAEQAVEWETLQQSLRQAKSDAEKARLDARQSEGAGIETELLRLNMEETQARYAKLLDLVRLQKLSLDADIRILDLSLQRQQRRHDRYLRELKKFTLTAPMDGMAVVQPLAPGDRVSPGQLLMKVVDAQTMQLEAHANQAESSLLHTGQAVEIRLDAFPQVSLAGHISSIGALAVGNNASFYVRNIAVNIAIDGTDPRLIPDLAGSGDVVLN